jgi:hypothetical protein
MTFLRRAAISICIGSTLLVVYLFPYASFSAVGSSKEQLAQFNKVIISNNKNFNFIISPLILFDSNIDIF